MSISNPSLLLQRNIDLLESKNPLLINCPDVAIISEMLNQNPSSNITSLHFNFAEYQSIKQHFNDAIFSTFTANYQSDILHDLVIIYFPKAKEELIYTLTMITRALANNARILLVGENNSGIKSANKLLVNFTTWQKKEDSAKHCCLLSAQFNNEAKIFAIEQWFHRVNITINNISVSLFSLPGVFSRQALDKGTAILLNYLPSNLAGKMLDFACGAGIVGIYTNKTNPDLTIDYIDVNALALASTEKSLKENGLTGNVKAANSLINVEGTYDVVISNPPFHQGVKTNYQATEYFLSNVKQRLAYNGQLFVVANSFLNYRPIIEEKFTHYKSLVNDKGFIVHYAK